MTSTPEARVLVVEDEASQLELLTYNFRKAGFDVFGTGDGEEGLLLAEELEPDLIVLDWMLPGLSGMEVCRRLKRGKGTRQIPIIMLTARGEEEDRVRGLDTGADEYVVKPYSIKLLLAQIRAILRRTRPSSVNEIMSYADIRVDAERHKVFRNDVIHKLSPTEYRLLTVLIERPERVFSRDQLLDRTWGNDSEASLRTVDVHVNRLRKALHQTGKPDPIRTVRGIGYSLDYDR